jgi:hypothetical protein
VGESLRWPRDTLYPLKLALTSPTRSGRSVGIVRLRTQATEFSFYLVNLTLQCGKEICIFLLEGLAESDGFRTPDILSSIGVFSFLRPRFSILHSCFWINCYSKKIFTIFVLPFAPWVGSSCRFLWTISEFWNPLVNTLFSSWLCENCKFHERSSGHSHL